MIDWFSKRLERAIAPAPSVLAGVDARPDGNGPYGLRGLVSRRPLSLAAIAGALVAVFALVPLDRLLVGSPPPATTPKIGQAEFDRMEPALQRCLYQIDPDSWAVRNECQAAGAKK